MLEYRESVVAELNLLEHAEETRAGLEAEQERRLATLLAIGQRLTSSRQNAGQLLSKALQQELADLAMTGAQFELQLTPLEGPGPFGLERGEFLLA